MSTTPTIQQSAEELKQAALNVPPPAAPEPPAAPTEPQPFQVQKTDSGVEVKLETGQVYKGATEAEALAALAKAQVEASKTIARLNRQPEVVPQATPTTPQLTPEQVAQQEADKYIADSVARVAGFSSAQEMFNVLGKTVQTSVVTERAAMEADFLTANPDFPDTKESAEALVKIMDDMGLPSNINSMNLAHAYAVKTGAYKALTQEQQQAKFAQAFPQQVNQSRQTPPPMLPGSSQSASPSGQAFNPYAKNVTTEQVRQWAIEAEKQGR